MANNPWKEWQPMNVLKTNRRRVIESINFARDVDACKPDEEVIYTEDQFIMIELLGYNPRTVDEELIYSFLKHINAPRFRPNTFIHQWAAWRNSHSCVKHE